MKVIEAARQDIDQRIMPTRTSQTGVPANVTGIDLTAPALVVDADTGTPILYAGRYSGDLGDLRRAARTYPISSTVRMATGMRNRSSVFGFAARQALYKKECCRVSNGADLAPEAHARIAAAAAEMFAMYVDVLGTQATADLTAAHEVILPEWLLNGSPWTSGVLNDTSPMAYHHDKNNLPTWSAMVVLRRNIEGGRLHVPEYGLLAECRDGDVIIFPGWKYLHGVTPMRRTARDGYRLTAVYYTISRMRYCLPVGQELANGRRSRSHREDDLLDRQLAPGWKP